MLERLPLSWAQRRPRSALKRFWWVSFALLPLLALASLWPRLNTIPAPSTQIRMSDSAWSGPQGNVGATRASVFAPAVGDVLWQKSFSTSGTFPPLADELGVYLASDDEQIVAYSPTGEERWEITVPGDLDSGPVLAEGLLIVAMRNGILAAYDRGTGATVWQIATHSQQIASPAVEAGVVWTSSLPELAAFDAGSGKALWQSMRGWDLRVAAISIARGHIAVAALKEAAIIDALSGERTYFLGVQEPIFIAATNTTVIAVSARNVVAFDPDSRRPWWEGARPAWNWMYAYQMAPLPPVPPRRWTLQLKEPVLPPALDDAHVFVADSRSVRAYALDTGDLKWSREETVTTAPVVTPAGLLLGSKGGLIVLDRENGQLLVPPFGPISPRAIAITADRTYVLDDTGIAVLGVTTH